MILFVLLLPAALSATVGAVSFSWTKCTNAPKCLSTGSLEGSSTTYSGVSASVGNGYVIYFPGGYISSYQASTGFSYDQSNGYWYSHDADGIYVSPAGYVNFAHGYNLIGLQNKDGDIGVTFWKNFGAPCCLPDQASSNIYDIIGYLTN